MTPFFSVPTPAGLAELAGALAAQQTVPFTHIAIGDGGGNAVDPTGRTGLVREVDRVKVSAIRKHPGNPNWLIVEGAIPETKGGYTVRELAIIGGRTPGQVLSVSNYPAVELAAPNQGVSTGMVLRMVVGFVDAGAVSLLVDPQAYATLQVVLDQIAAHEAKINPHPQYTKPGDVAKALGDALQAHVAAADPHEQYLVQADADAIVQRLVEHEKAVDPHPQYLNANRAAAAAQNLWAEEYLNATM